MLKDTDENIPSDSISFVMRARAASSSRAALHLPVVQKNMWQSGFPSRMRDALSMICSKISRALAMNSPRG